MPTKLLIIVIGVICLCSCVSNPKISFIKSTPPLNLKRLTGTWYEIAAIREERCVCTTFNFTWQKDHLKIQQRCWQGGMKGQLKSMTMLAYSNSPTHTKLQILYPNGSKTSEYWILDLGKHSRYLMAGSPDRKNLWILSRRTDLADTTLLQLRTRANALGFAINNLQMTDQSC